MQRPGAMRRELANDMHDGIRLVVGLLAVIALGVWLLVVTR